MPAEVTGPHPFGELELQRQTGWVVVNPTAAERVDPKTRDRTERERHVRTVTFEGRDGVYEVDVWYSGGRLCRLDYTDEGTPVLIALERVGNPVRPNRDGTFRTYVEYRVPNPEGRAPQIIREPTYTRDNDTFNRAENIRQIPRRDPDYERLMGRRSDAEAANRQIDDLGSGYESGWTGGTHQAKRTHVVRDQEARSCPKSFR